MKVSHFKCVLTKIRLLSMSLSSPYLHQMAQPKVEKVKIREKVTEDRVGMGKRYPFSF